MLTLQADALSLRTRCCPFRWYLYAYRHKALSDTDCCFFKHDAVPLSTAVRGSSCVLILRVNRRCRNDSAMPISQNAERLSTRSTSRDRHATRDPVPWHWTVAGPAFPPGIQFPRKRECAPGGPPAVGNPLGENTRDQNSARERLSHTQCARMVPNEGLPKSLRAAPPVVFGNRYPAKQVSNVHFPLSGRGLISLTAF